MTNYSQVSAEHKIVSSYQPDDSIARYGDGIFETMLAVGDGIHNWHYHWQRLHSSCRRLQITPPSHDLLLEQLGDELKKQQHHYAVIKLVVSRGQGLRGYRSLSQQPCYGQISVVPHAFEPERYSDGVALRVCQMRLAEQPLLAGMKHLNRLEYVMARRESDDRYFDEGLLLNAKDQVVEGIISNVFIINARRVLTPSLNLCGVAGSMRACLLATLTDKGYDIGEAALTLADIAAADGVFLTNATHGITPVKQIQGIDKNFSIGVVNSLRREVEHPCCVF